MSCYYPNMIAKKGSCTCFIGGLEAKLKGYKNGDIKVDEHTGEIIEYINVPCGQCIGCRLDQSRTWADRCVLEGIEHDENSNWFVTLTYDDFYVPRSEKNTLTLKPDDLSGFMKRLRRYCSYNYGINENIRFYGCGEYGSLTMRPHYHLLLFGLNVDSGLPVAKNKFGDFFYKLDCINDTWKFGHNVVGRMTWQSAAYTARYCTKKWKGAKKDEYKQLAIEPEFSRQSNRPGIGSAYFDKHYNDIYNNDRIVLQAKEGKKQIVRPPKYFDDKYRDINPDDYEKIKERRKIAFQHMKNLREQYTDLDEDEYLNLQAISLEKKIDNILPRIEI